jgi:hypothetical protein
MEGYAMSWFSPRERMEQREGMTEDELGHFMDSRVAEAIREKNRLRQLAVVGKLKKPTIWHGGCIGCIEQKRKGMNYCLGCQYFDAQWEKPDLSKTEGDLMKQEIKTEWFGGDGMYYSDPTEDYPEPVQEPVQESTEHFDDDLFEAD